MGVTLTKKDKLDEFKKRMKSLGRIRVLVGIPQEETARDGEPVTNAELLYIHTHGVRQPAMKAEMQQNIDKGMKYSKAHALYVKSYGSPLWQVPPRPVIEPAIEANKETIADLMKTGMKDYMHNRNSLNGFRRAGLFGATAAKNWFQDPRNEWAENAPSTIKRKGSDLPLIDTGDLRASITYVIRKE